MELKRKELGEEAKKARGKSASPSTVKGPDEPQPERDEAALADGAEVQDPRPDEGTIGGPVWPWLVRIRRFGFLALGLLLVAACAFFIIKFKPYTMLSTNALPRLEPLTSIMRPIPMPDYRDTLDFLLAYQIKSQTMFTAVRMEVGFQNPTRFQNFKDRNVAFRDTVYSFLLQQNLPGKTMKSWHSIVENDLPDYLRVKLPQSCADEIKLAQVENL